MKYELTLTLRPIYYQYTPQNQFNMANMILFDILSPYEVSLVAELTNEQNIHFHGLIELEDIRSKCKLLNKFRSYHKIFGKKTCDQVVFEDSYRKYMCKSIEETKKIITDPIVRDSFGVFKTIFI